MSNLPKNITPVAEVHQNKAKESLKKLGKQIINVSENGNLIAIEDLNKFHKALGSLIKIYGIKKSMAEDVRDWLNISRGVFTTNEIIKDLNITDRGEKQNLSKILNRLISEQVIIKHGDKRGCFRTADTVREKIDWTDADPEAFYPIVWPFKIEELVKIYPKNLAVIAGDSNAGKTAFLLSLAHMNSDTHNINFFSSELSKQELKARIEGFTKNGVDIERFGKINFEAYYGNPLDIIEPDSLNIIDYIELTDEFWKVAALLAGIHNKLKSGIAVAAIQKKKGTNLGRGGDFALEKARLYLSMEKGKLTIIKGKNWTDEEVDPEGKFWKFSLHQGCRFARITTGHTSRAVPDHYF